MIDAMMVVKALLEELASVASAEDMATREASWLRGYVAGITNAASIALELDEETHTGKGAPNIDTQGEPQ